VQISGAVTIKYDTLLDASGKGEFINSNTLKESSASFLISVKVVNQIISDTSLVKFAALNGVSPGDFTKVYGDCFISGPLSLLHQVFFLPA
jgi:hypothetical protein